MPAIGSELPPGRLRIKSSLRLRLTLLYGVLFLLSGAALLGITYALVAYGGAPRTYVLITGLGRNEVATDSASDRQYARSQTTRLHATELRQLLVEATVAMVIMGALSMALGWLMAGRVLHPVRMMAAKAQRISELNLHERLAVGTDDDELGALANTFDGLLGRLQTAFESQRRFVANASHELRTPLTLQRALLEVALSDPRADASSLRDVCAKLLRIEESQERLIEALLTLASSQRGLDCREPTDLSVVVGQVAQHLMQTPYCPFPNKISLQSDLAPALTAGAPALIDRLVGNLIQNAVQHNIPGGWIRMFTGVRDSRVVLQITNSGPIVPVELVDTLLQPFQRLERRVDHRDGHGLGLSIVAAIAKAHNATLRLTPIAAGGLDVEVGFPACVSENQRDSLSRCAPS